MFLAHEFPLYRKSSNVFNYETIMRKMKILNSAPNVTFENVIACTCSDVDTCIAMLYLMLPIFMGLICRQHTIVTENTAAQEKWFRHKTHTLIRCSFAFHALMKMMSSDSMEY